jgi:hypothetical protein
VNYWENNRFNPEVRYVPQIVAFLGYEPFNLGHFASKADSTALREIVQAGQ